MITDRPDEKETFVIKVGTDTLSDNGRLNEDVMADLADQIAAVKKSARIVLVTSGAIGAGKSLVSEKIWQKVRHMKQALSGLGQVKLMDKWSDQFERNDILCAQGLLEDHDMETEEGRGNIRSVFRDWREIERLGGVPILPIINGNDLVTFGPIRSDNDRIAAGIASVVEASRLILLTNVDGLFDGNPHDSSSRLLREISVGRDNWRQYVRDTRSANGSGGFLSKGDAAEMAVKDGIIAYIGNGRVHNAIQRLLDGEIGTMFMM